ncbi:hypothetical protein [Streptomyces sp. 3N207]|uniref:hypothetical protein n=1 Tax=Streptomyces sp. 3N207 TaxID=3457417 RepID=UPI003FD0A8BA
MPRPHAETVTDTDGRRYHIRLGVFRSNTRGHHKQHKLTSEQTRKAFEVGLLT